MKVHLVNTRRRDAAAFAYDSGDPASRDAETGGAGEDFVWSVMDSDDRPRERGPRWFGGRWSWKRGHGGRRR